MKFRYLPLFAAATALVAAGGGSAPAASDISPAPDAPGDEPAAEPEAPAETEDSPADPVEEPADEPAPAEPAEPEPAGASASSAPAKLTAFQRGALRALGTGDLVARVEKAEEELSVAHAEVSRLAAENQRLAADLAAARKDTAAKVEAAETVGADKLRKGVTAELAALGIDAAKAPAALTPEQADNTMTYAEFEKLEHSERNRFMRGGGKIARS